MSFPASDAIERRVTLGVSIGAIMVALLVGLATTSPARVAALRANGGYILVDNRTRREVIVLTGFEDGQVCGRTRIGSGNRGRVRACGAWSPMLIAGRGGDAAQARLMAGQGEVYLVRWRGTLIAEKHEPY